MDLRGQAAIVGIGEIPTARAYPGRSEFSLYAEAFRLALADAGLRKQDIDGLFCEPRGAGAGGSPAVMAEHLGLRPPLFSTGVSEMGATGATATLMASLAVSTGMCNYALVVLGAGRAEGPPPGGGPATQASEFESTFGPAPGAGTHYALMYQRHMYEYGSKPEQFAKIAADQRFNALNNPNSAFKGQPITVEDVLNSRYVNSPLHLLECVMPSAGAAACIVTTAERARALTKRPVYILGGGIEQFADNVGERPRITVAPTGGSARRAFAMAGYNPSDMEFAEFYD